MENEVQEKKIALSEDSLREVEDAMEDAYCLLCSEVDGVCDDDLMEEYRNSIDQLAKAKDIVWAALHGE